ERGEGPALADELTRGFPDSGFAADQEDQAGQGVQGPGTSASATVLPPERPAPGESAEPAESAEPVPSPDLTEPRNHPSTDHLFPAQPSTAHPDLAVAPDAQPTPAAATGLPSPVERAEAPSEHPHTSYVLRVNGVDRPVTDAWIGESLLYVLRERLGLAGAKDGCAQGECGACSVQVDGRLVAACLVPAATTAGSEVRTVEGLAVDGEPSDVQRALTDCGAVQCGFCAPGLAMAVHDLLEGNHEPTELETRRALCGNLCRCSGYRGVLDVVRTVTEERADRLAALEEAEDRHSDNVGGIPHQAPGGDA
ncbi:(2Fe-2S)-binding protein, partial [Streptomyces oceani]|uniref:(2Fe-2S)-binding protein n=1 Tax=Streptomyces oceani TaxID=1075402 RepID=UPI000A991FD0